jgi:hypothetical protein
MAITPETLTAADTLRTQIGAPADAATRSHTVAWAASWAGLTAAILAMLAAADAATAILGHWPRPWEWARLAAANTALDAATAELTRLTVDATTTASTAATSAISATLTGEPAIIVTQVPASRRAETITTLAAVTASIVAEQLASAATARITRTMSTIPAATMALIRQVLYRGPRAKVQLIDDIRAAYAAGLDRAMTTTRTEVLDAYRATAQAIHQALPYLVGGWTWSCRLDTRVCPACLAMHGSTFPAHTPGPIDHQCGRCQRIPTVLPWATLGWADTEPASALPDARAWFATLPDADRMAILGPGRLALMDAGLIGWDDIPRIRHAPMWRDSYRPATLAELKRLAAQLET